MEWKVTGADRSTGKDRTCIVTAESREDAEARAVSDFGLLVSSIEPQRPATALSYSSKSREPVIVPPTYAALSTVTWVIQIIGFIFIGLAIVILIFAWRDIAARGGRPGPADVLALIGMVGAPAFFGLILIAFGELLSCVRDMAVNSFKLVNKFDGA